MDLKTYLIVTGMIGISYITYKYVSKPSVAVLPLDLTQKISQQIKHQVMIVGISYSQAMRKIRQDNKQKLKKSGQEIFLQFRNQLSTIYLQKQNLILKKYTVSRDMYGRSLEKFKNDKIINRNQVQIIDILERAINGQQLDFTIPDEVKRTFRKQTILTIYKDMVALIGKLVMNKLQQQKRKNPNFDSANDEDFRKAIRQLSIYDVKVKFLEDHGFKKSWGCSNEVFFKFFESEKLKDAEYHKVATIYQKTYEKLIEIVSQDPDILNQAKIDQMFVDCLKEQQVKPKPKVQQIKPIQKIVPVQKKVEIKPQPLAQPKKKQQNQDDYLQELMMQQLMNRSQAQSKVQKQEVAAISERVQSEQIPVIQSIKSEDQQKQKQKQGEIQVEVAQNQQLNNEVEQQFNQSTQEAFVLAPQIEEKEGEVIFGEQQKKQEHSLLAAQKQEEVNIKAPEVQVQHQEQKVVNQQQNQIAQEQSQNQHQQRNHQQNQHQENVQHQQNHQE